MKNRTTNPQLEAERSIRKWTRYLSEAESAWNDLDDSSIYECRLDFGLFERIKRRQILKITAKQIRLAPISEFGIPGNYLNRSELETGGIVEHGKGYWSSHFAYGWKLRKPLENQQTIARRVIEMQQAKLAVLENAALQQKSRS